MRMNNNWFTPLFKLNRFYAGNEVSGFVILGIEVDLRPWYVHRVPKDDEQWEHLLKDNWIDKNGWTTCWDTWEEMEGAKNNPDIKYTKNLDIKYRKLSLLEVARFPQWMYWKNLLLWSIGVLVGWILSVTFL